MMFLSRRSVFNDVPSLFREFDELFRQNVPAATTRGVYPAVEVFKREDNLVFRAELPGVKPDDVDVTLENGLLILSGEKKEKRESGEGDAYLSETFEGSFKRSFRLPDGVKTDGVEASFDNGVLEVKLPFEDPTTGRKIPVKFLGSAKTESQAA